MSYGSGANWAGNDTSGNATAVTWSTETTASPSVTESASFSIPANSNPVQAAEAMKNGWNDVPSNVKVTQKGATVRWPKDTNITNMSFTVNGGPSQEVPGLGNAVPVYDELTVKNVS